VLTAENTSFQLLKGCPVSKLKWSVDMYMYMHIHITHHTPMVYEYC